MMMIIADWRSEEADEDSHSMRSCPSVCLLRVVDGSCAAGAEDFSDL